MKRNIVLAAVVALAIGSGCALNKPARHIQEVGFLSDYSILSKGGKHQAELVYIAPDTDWAKYDKMMIDPVMIFRGTESRSRGLSHVQAQALANYFYALIRDGFAKDFELVTEPGPNTLRAQVAITKADETYVVPEVIATIVPQARGLDTLQSLATGRLAFSGSAQVEARVTDSESGQILAEGVDRRIGGKRLNEKYLETWGDVENIMKFWTARSVHNMCVIQGRKDCGKAPSNRLGTT